MNISEFQPIASVPVLFLGYTDTKEGIEERRMEFAVHSSFSWY
jgi:hypothetical protein